MSWATHHIAELQAGRTVSFRPRGNSMTPTIRSGQKVTVAPITDEPTKGSIVLCRVRGAQYLHFVTAVRADEYQIGNAHGRINGWVGRNAIYGVLTSVEP